MGKTPTFDRQAIDTTCPFRSAQRCKCKRLNSVSSAMLKANLKTLILAKNFSKQNRASVDCTRNSERKQFYRLKQDNAVMLTLTDRTQDSFCHWCPDTIQQLKKSKMRAKTNMEISKSEKDFQDTSNCLITCSLSVRNRVQRTLSTTCQKACDLN